MPSLRNIQSGMQKIFQSFQFLDKSSFLLYLTHNLARINSCCLRERTISTKDTCVLPYQNICSALTISRETNRDYNEIHNYPAFYGFADPIDESVIESIAGCSE